MQTLENKTVLITGGSKGIGYGIAEALILPNAKIAITPPAGQRQSLKKRP